jgi:hypothetical protein
MMKKFVVLICVMVSVLGLMSGKSDAYVSWTYDSVIDVKGFETDNMDGTWTYDFTITNTDSAAIYFTSIYTLGFEAYDMTSSIPEWEKEAYTQFTNDGADWNIAGLGDSWFAGYFNRSYPEIALLGVGETATVGFTIAGQLNSPAYYAYWIQDDWEWNRYTAVGKADIVPEPSTLFLFGIGVLGLVGLGRKKFKK